MGSLFITTLMAGLVWLAAGVAVAEPPKPEVLKPSAGDHKPVDEADYLFQAHDLFMAGQYDEALAAYDRLALDDGKRIEATLGAVRCLSRLGQHDLALRRLKTLAAKDSADWQLAMARMLRRTGDYEGAIKRCERAVSLDSHHTGARLLWGQTLELLGHRRRAIEVYRWFDKQLVARADLPPDAAWLTDVAVGFLRYSTLTKTNLVPRTKHVLTEMLQAAYSRLDRRYWPARLAAGDLLRDKHNNDEGEGSISDYQAALGINPNLCEAHVGLGAVALEAWEFEKVQEQVDKALALDPTFAPALYLQAQRLILERRYKEAGEPCERALKINPNDLNALSLLAAASACRFDDKKTAALEARVAAINPTCALFYRTLGDALGGIRQYAESEAQYMRAIEYEPSDANARTELGMMYMQWGLEDKARTALQGAWSLDPFNQRTKFTLDLLDSLQAFDTVVSDHFIVRYDTQRDPTLGAFADALLEEIYPAVTGDFDVELKDKTTVEIFPSSRSFAVRITGKPWIHTVGACTGRVIALSSPRTDPKLLGQYDLKRVLTHEFTHTVTLAATKNRIPHWFTEGLAVMQEDSPPSFDWLELLAQSARRGELFSLESIDWGFMRPRKPSDRQLAYAQSEWMCQYIVERFGYDKILAMLAAYRNGKTQKQVFEGLLSISMSEFSRDFQEFAAKQLKQWGFDLTPPEDPEVLRKAAAEHPGDATLAGRLARAQLDAGLSDLALTAARSALKQDENQRIALEVAVRVLGDTWQQAPSSQQRQAIRTELDGLLKRLLTLEPNHREALALAATMDLHNKKWDQAEALLKRLQVVAPANPVSWRGLAGIYLQRGDDDKALPQLLELSRLGERDAGVAAQMASIFRQRGRMPEAFYWFRQALNRSPLEVSLHRQYGDTLMQAGKTAKALDQYLLLTKLDADSARHFELAATAAYKLGEKEKAVRLARRAVELDPSSSAASMLP